MVLFFSKSNIVTVAILVSSLSINVIAAPGKFEVVHGNSTIDGSVVLPPILKSRCTIPGDIYRPVNVSTEADIIEKNNQWMKKHQKGSDKSKREAETVGGMTLELPETVPPLSTPSVSTVVTATTAQVTTFKKYAEIASTAYCRSVVPSNNWDCKHCLTSVPDGKLLKTFSSLISDTNGFVLRSDKDKAIYLVFRGTNSIRSAIVDIQFILTDYSPVKGAKVHTGFLNSYNDVVKSYFPIIQDQLTANPSYKVIVTGHSLGGAQALLAGLDLFQREKRLGPKNLSIYTVGGPRVGNPTFAYYVEGTGIPFHRTVHKRDIVPHLPPQAFGFLHPGVESWIHKDPDNVLICTPTIEIGDCSNSIVPFTSIADHLTYFNINEGSCL